jgi:hypothetical protein
MLANTQRALHSLIPVIRMHPQYTTGHNYYAAAIVQYETELFDGIRVAL